MTFDTEEIGVAQARTTYWDGATVQETMEKWRISRSQVYDQNRDYLKWADGDFIRLSVGGWIRLRIGVERG